MADGVQIEVFNVSAAMRALQVAPLETEKAVRGVLWRGFSTFRKRVIKNRTNGPPGISWDQSKKRIGGNIKINVTGDRLDEMVATVKLSSYLMKHETGGVVTGKDLIAVRLKPGLPAKPDRQGLFFLQTSKGLFLARKEGDQTELLYALRRSITLKPRLGLRAEWRAYEPSLIVRLNRAVQRAMERTFEKNVKGITGAISGIGE